MSKHNHNRRARRTRRWLKNVGDGAKLSREGNNPNDAKK